LKMGTRRFDVIIIESGPAGMTAGSLLAGSGEKVLIVDSGDRLGGEESAWISPVAQRSDV
jgi:phytoene dehydrogenase-like protein